MTPKHVILPLLSLLPFLTLACTSNTSNKMTTTNPSIPPSTPQTTPPPKIQAWMDRLDVAHSYDPATGFIVANEIIPLHPIITNAPPLDQALNAANTNNQIVIAFATADRCAPCQQYKKSALNDPRVIAALSNPRFIPTHVEVDKQPNLADNHLPSRAIPMTYALHNNQTLDTLKGQRAPEELLAWLSQLDAAHE